MQTLERLDRALPGRMVEHMLAWPQTYSPDAAVVPLAKHLLENGTPPGAPALARLLRVALAHLESRTAQPLEPPQDWARPNDVPCTCEHCAQLRDFLANPLLPVWKLKAAERTRRHVERTAKDAQCDLDITTERSGTPASLLCQKNSASYERRAAQRSQDLADLSVLKGNAAPLE